MGRRVVRDVVMLLGGDVGWGCCGDVGCGDVVMLLGRVGRHGYKGWQGCTVIFNSFLKNLELSVRDSVLRERSFAVRILSSKKVSESTNLSTCALARRQ